ncbi:hypothetical protein LG784_001527 [Vibrio cholerae]|nr:hypothetical protein [Vibrio cholerae]
MSQNEIKLPTGSDRNKIEALAEQIGQAGEAIKTLQASGAQIEEIKNALSLLSTTAEPDNLLINPAFEVIESDLTPKSGNALIWLGTPHKIAAQGGNFGVGNATAYPMPFGWSIECVAGLSNVDTSFSVHYLAVDGDIFLAAKNSNVQASVLPETYQKDTKVCTFSVFRAPMLRSSRVNDNGLWVYTKPQYSAYFVGRLNGGATFGIAKINNKGSVEKIVASKVIQQNTDMSNLEYSELNPNGEILTEDWIHGIELQEGGVYAYFVSEISKGTSVVERITHIAAAGVFLNSEKQNIKPSIRSKVSPDKYLKCSHSLGVVSSSELAAGFVADLTGYSMQYGIDKHTLFCVVSDDKWRMPLGAKTSATKLSETSATIKCNAGGAVDFYYSETPLTIDFFNAV